MKELAGRRRTIGEAFVEKSTGDWRTSGSETRIEHWDLKRVHDWDMRCPFGRIAIHMLPHGMRIKVVGCDSVRNG